MAWWFRPRTALRGVLAIVLLGNAAALVALDRADAAGAVRTSGFDAVCNAGRGAAVTDDDEADMWSLADVTLVDGAQVLLETYLDGNADRQELQAITSDCRTDRAFGHDGVVSLPSTSTDPGYTSMLALRDGRDLLFGTSARGGAWVLEELSHRGEVVTSFGHGGIARIRSRGGQATAILAGVELPDGSIALGADVGARSQSSQVLEITARGAPVAGFGRGGLAHVLPRGDGLSQLLLLSDGTLLAVGGTSPYVNYSSGSFWITALTARGTPEPVVTKRFDALIRRFAISDEGIVLATTHDQLEIVAQRRGHCAARSTWCTIALSVHPDGVVVPHSEMVVFAYRDAEDSGWDLTAAVVGGHVVVGEEPPEQRDFVLREVTSSHLVRRFGRGGSLTVRLPDEESWNQWTLLPILAMTGPRSDVDAVIPEPYGVRVLQVRT
jgi:hypothetical protein